MQTVNVIRNNSIGGMTIASTYTVQAEGIITQSVTIPMAEGGTLTTRTSDTAGVITLTEAGAMPASGIGDLYSSEGNVYQCTFTRSGSLVTITVVGSGVLPTESSAVVFCDTIQVDAAFDADNMDFMSSILDKAGHVAFCITGGDSELDVDLVANQDYGWDNTSGYTNPIAGHDIVYLLVSTSDIVADGTFKCGILYDSTT